jgi:hypothetical protein
MMKTFKAQGLSMNVIVAAAIALIVLVVVISIFYGKSNVFSKGLDDCSSKGGKCVPESQCGLGKLYICQKEGEVCCIGSCEAKGGICQQSCSPDQDKVYFAECENNGECCVQK